MSVFITGTDTNIGKTIISAWICTHLRYAYFKPIQTGTDTDSDFISKVTSVPIYESTFYFPEPIAPHIAAKNTNKVIDISKISMPDNKKVLVEGAGGVLVPLHGSGIKIIDLIQSLELPAIVVASDTLGTINHTLLTLEALRARKIKVLGVIMNSTSKNKGLGYNAGAINHYGSVEILMNFPYLESITEESLSKIPVTKSLEQVL
ncbi:dethiobiotin synthase [Neorickettsia helminthoeca str. Oregon]|uniref:ATP-dependent dethiobiotin synthetase BioD n=1 Tax=Neorickettsia helminthoeca str. Oregon TaxID=1286528 RepID=X5HKG5_9RICK|nr:dethiobiotin synthase [Neorickettsia helminthoeca]AHX11529.1 dethiobiotin synthase [Neorickettsia helminthoeca str. Oregon]